MLLAVMRMGYVPPSFHCCEVGAGERDDAHICKFGMSLGVKFKFTARLLLSYVG